MVPSEGVLPCTVNFYLGISLECKLYFINCELFFWCMAMNFKSFCHLLQFFKISKSVDQSLKLLCITIGINRV